MFEQPLFFKSVPNAIPECPACHLVIRHGVFTHAVCGAVGPVSCTTLICDMQICWLVRCVDFPGLWTEHCSLSNSFIAYFWHATALQNVQSRYLMPFVFGISAKKFLAEICVEI